jgi:hypothetical protein
MLRVELLQTNNAMHTLSAPPPYYMIVLERAANCGAVSGAAVGEGDTWMGHQLIY